LGEGIGVGFLLFPMCSHQVPNMFLVAFHFIPYLLPYSSILLTSITSPNKGITTYLFGDYPKFHSFFVMGKSNTPIIRKYNSKKMEICGSPQLIDMFTIYHLITNEIDLKNKLPPKRTIHMI
jgi:hypothetical protein